MKHFESQISNYVQENDIDVIHAHTPYRVGIPSMNVAKKLEKKFVYEMRGMWEETAVANGRWRRNGLAYSRFRRFENKVLTSADSIVAISNELKEDLMLRGIPKNKITIVPNGIEQSSSNIESSKFESIQNELDKLDGEITVGYIGSLRELEGVDMAVDAVSELLKKGHDVKFFCLTGTNGQEELRHRSDNLGLKARSLITGPVPHLEVKQYYDLIDIFVVSRPDYPVTRAVTPLKPFEAMAQSLPVVVTNLPALTEIIENSVTGIVTENNDLSSLVRSIEVLIQNSDLREKLGRQAKIWVQKERSWSDLVQRYSTVYAE
jgi:glycosyltransferase involved in cell wall biosynthesis